MEDDWMEDEDSHDDDAPQETARELDHLQKSMHKVGLLNGIEKGRKVALQEGFNQGFASGLKRGYHSNCLQGVIRAYYSTKPSAAAPDDGDVELSALLEDLEANGYVGVVNRLKELNF